MKLTQFTQKLDILFSFKSPKNWKFKYIKFHDGCVVIQLWFMYIILWAHKDLYSDEIDC